MLIEWVRKWFGIVTSTNNDRRRNKKSTIEELDLKLQSLVKSNFTKVPSSTSWYYIEAPIRKKRIIQIFNSRDSHSFPSLFSLKIERQEKEKIANRIIEENISSMMGVVENLISKQNADKAKIELDKILCLMPKSHSVTLNQRLQKICDDLSSLIIVLEEEERQRARKEKQLKEDRERRRREEKEREKKKREEKEKAEKERREADALRLQREAKQREEAYRKEKERLISLSAILKPEWEEIVRVLKDNGIGFLYHFTDRRNLSSIKRSGGLLSWSYCEKNNIIVPRPGGGDISRQLDKRRNLQDYVRLSFTTQHPMMYAARSDGRISDPVILQIDVKAACINGTLYSDKNATMTREMVNIGESVEDLKKIHFKTVKAYNHFDLDEDERSFFQAEVMIKTFLPKEYILNLDAF